MTTSYYPKTLKALTLREPWGTLLVHGCKTEEYRSWNTKMRGLILIHTSLTYQIDWQEVFKLFFLPCPKELPLNRILGAVELYDSVPEPDGSGFAWKVKNAIKFQNPPECRGALSFWQPKEDEQRTAFASAWEQLPADLKNK